MSARLMPAERTRAVCDGLAAALRAYGCPSQLLTDNGRVFTGRFFHPPVEVFFDRICRENGIEHLLTAPRSPTTTGKIERFHRTPAGGVRHRVGCSPRCGRPRPRWMSGCSHYNTERPHQSLDGATPAERFSTGRQPASAAPTAAGRARRRCAATARGPHWVSRRVAANGVISVSWQQVCVGAATPAPASTSTSLPELLQIWHGDELIKTVHPNQPRGGPQEERLRHEPAPARRA